MRGRWAARAHRTKLLGTLCSMRYAKRSHGRSKRREIKSRVPNRSCWWLGSKAQVRRRTRADALLAWMRPLLLSALAGLLAIWWERIATVPLDVALATEPWMQAIGLAALLVCDGARLDSNTVTDGADPAGNH